MSGTFNPEGEPEGSGEPGYKVVFASDRSANETDNAPYLAIYSGQVAVSQQHNEGRGENLASTWMDAEDISSGTDYEFRFSAIGDIISASLWTLDTPQQQLGSVTLNDASYTNAGYFGLNISGESSGTRGYFSNLEVIPEPGTASLLLGSLVALGLLRRRWRR